MSKRPKKGSLVKGQSEPSGYSTALVEIVELLEDARRLASRSVNAIMTAAYWEIGRRIVEIEQQGKGRADYGEQVIDRLSEDLTARLGRGFGRRNLFQMRAFYLAYGEIVQTVSAQSEGAPGPDTTPRQGLKSLPRLPDDRLRQSFPLSWSHYVKLLAVKNPKARQFYEAEALRGGWTIKQLSRQINSQFYERTALSRNKAAMLRKGKEPLAEDAVTPEEEIKDPFVLEFLGLKDEYSESELEEALIRQLEHFLLELGEDFAFIGRQGGCASAISGSRRPTVLSPGTALPGHHRSEDRRVHARRRGTDAPLPELRA